MSIDTIELCSSRDVGQGGVGGARKCSLADIGATMAKCYDDARREGSPIDLITWDEANRTARGDARVTHNAGALRGRQLLDAEFRKAMTEGKITASVTTSQDELSPVSMIVRSTTSEGIYNIGFYVDGANNKQLPPLFAHAACVAIELTLEDSSRAWVVLSLCNEALWDELSERLVKVLSIHRNVVGACLDDCDVEWGANSTLSPELRAVIENNVCRPSQLKARVDAYVTDWVQLVRRQLDLLFPLESGPAPFETAVEFVDALVEAGPAAAVDVPSTSRTQPLRVPRSGAGHGQGYAAERRLARERVLRGDLLLRKDVDGLNCHEATEYAIDMGVFRTNMSKAACIRAIKAWFEDHGFGIDAYVPDVEAAQLREQRRTSQAQRRASQAPAPAPAAPAPAPAPAGGPAASNGDLFLGARVELENADLLGWPGSRGTVITLGNDHVDVDLEIDGQPSSIIKRVWAPADRRGPLRIIDDDQSSDGGGRSLKGDDDDDDATLSDTELERHERETVAATNAANAAIASARDCETDSEDELERARADETDSEDELENGTRAGLLDKRIANGPYFASKHFFEMAEEVHGPYLYLQWRRMNAEDVSPEELRAASRWIGPHRYVSFFHRAPTALGLQIQWNTLYNLYQRPVLWRLSVMHFVKVVAPEGPPLSVASGSGKRRRVVARPVLQRLSMVHFATVVAPEGPPRHVAAGPGKRRRVVAAPASPPVAGLVSTPAPALVQPHGLPRDNPGDGGAARQRFLRDHHTAARRSAAPSRLAAYLQVRGSIFP